MNQNQDTHVIYQELLTSSMQKILKQLPKQVTNLKQLVENAIKLINEVKSDASRFDTNANKYFLIYKYAIELKQPRLTECCLYDLEKLISANFLDGYSYDFVESDQTHPKFKKYDRMLIDSIVEIVLLGSEIEDENIHYLAVQCLNVLLKQTKAPISRETLLLCLKRLFHFYKQGLSSTKPIIQNSVKVVYERALQCVPIDGQITELFKQRGQACSIEHSFQVQAQEQPMNSVDEYISNYVQLTLVSLVDDVVIYFERLRSGQQNVPMRSVPLQHESEDAKYKNLVEIKIENPQGYLSGKFGWCIMCRQAAPYFCKATRVPVCSVPCKKKHFELSENIKVLTQPQNTLQTSVSDAVDVFRYLSRNMMDDKKAKQEISADLIGHIIKEYPIIMAVINDRVFDEGFIVQLTTLMRNKKYSRQALQILFDLIVNLRDRLILQIEACLDFVIHKLTPHPDYQTCVLLFCSSLCDFPILVLELFCNHDCTLNRKNIVQFLIEALAKLGQGEKVTSDVCQLANQIINSLIANFVDIVSNSSKQSLASQAPEVVEENGQQIQQIIRSFEAFDSHEKQLTQKQQIAKAMSKFQVDPKDCFEYLEQVGILEPSNDKQAADFLFKHPVSKEQLGVYFGNAKDFNQKVLSQYTRMIDLKGLNIIDALRKFLNHFTLPGEAQQVDRIMLVFSQKYYEDNQENSAFLNADEAYIFSYLLMILQTDVHNKSVQKKMTFQQFQKSSKLSLERDLNQDYLNYAYNQILEKPLAIHPSLDAQQSYSYQMVALPKDIQFETYIFNPPIDYIKLFMEVIWPSLFVNLNVLIERSEDQVVITLGLQNAQKLIHLMTMVGLQEHCEGFIRILCNLASLKENKQIKFKNLKALQCIMNLAIQQGNSLRNNWAQVLDIISQLDFLFGEKQRGKTLPEPLESTSRAILTFADAASIDKVMQNTRQMDSRTILDFLQALIDVSLNEITMPEPRIFSLQRLVEVTSFNMDRIRLIWTQIWNLLKGHFVTACVHQNLEIALYSCDQLKQMSVKFLQRHEHNKFNFQKEFLQPFDLIFAQTKHYEVKEFILSCIRMLSHLCFFNLKSGWKIVLNIINQGLQDNIGLVNIAVEVIEKIVSEDMSHVIEVFDEIELAFRNVFAREENHILIKGTELVYNAVDHLIKKQDSSVFYAFWMQSLAHICNLFRSNQQELQEYAIKSFFKLIKSNAKSIRGNSYLQIVRGMMKHLFQSLDNARKEVVQMAHESLLEQILEQGESEVLAEVLTFLLTNCSKSNESLVKVSVLTFKQVLEKRGKFLNWEHTIGLLEQMVQATTPTLLYDAAKLDDSLISDLITLNIPELDFTINSDLSVLQSLLQLMIIDIIDDIRLYNISYIENQSASDSPQQMFTKLVEIAGELYRKSYQFNRQYKVRYFLQKKGLMAHLAQFPGLIKQEKQAFGCLLNWLMYMSLKSNDFDQTFSLIYDLLNDTSKMSQQSLNSTFQIEQERLIVNNLLIIQNSVLPVLHEINPQQLKIHAKKLLEHLVRLPACSSLQGNLCPSCSKCPYQCSQKSEWKKLQIAIQNLQLKLIKYL